MRRTPQWTLAAVAVLLACAAGARTAEPVAAPSISGIAIPKNLAALAETADAPLAAAPHEHCADPCDCRKWSFRFIPYGWVPGFHGDLTIRNVTAPVDVSIGKVWDIIVDSVDFAALGQVEASNGRFGFIFNGLFLDVSPKAQVRNLRFTEDLVITILDLTATVNVPQVPEALCLPEGSKFEFLGGFRYVALSSALVVRGPLGNIGAARGTEDWFDPIVGSRLRMPLTQCLTAQVRGDVGGFDWAEASRFTWNIETTVEYRLNDRASILAGYRWLDIDKTEGSGSRTFRFDMNLNGPMLGFAFDF